MNQIHAQLLAKYPLLGQLTLRSTRQPLAPEPLLPFLGLVLSVLENPPARPVCFVLPKRGDTARLAAVLYCLLRIRQTHKQFIDDLAHQKFRKGQAVSIHPSREVFIYDGICDDIPDHFWLQELDLSRPVRGYRTRFPMRMSFPLWTIQRLEKTNAKRPKGDIRKRATELLYPPQAPIDTILGTNTFGNLSCIKNVGVVLDTQGEFMDFVASSILESTSNQPISAPSDSIIPVGWLEPPGSTQQGWLRKAEGDKFLGEPLIAVAHSAELLANFCIDSPSHSKLVLINGLSRFRNNRQTYDDIAETQHLVLFADASEEEMIEVLGAAPRPTRFWWLAAKDIRLNAHPTGARSTGILANVSRWALNHESLNVEAEPCENQHLERACLLLEKLHAAVRDAEDSPLTKVVSRAWRMLNDACAVIRMLSPDERQKAQEQVGLLRQETTRYTAWLSPEQAQILSDVADLLEASFAPESGLGIQKGDALYRLVQAGLSSGSHCALIARNENQVAELRLWLRQRGFWKDTEVYSPRTLPEDAALDGLVCVSWLGGESMRQLASSLVAPSLKVVAYPFEQRWLKVSKQRFQRRANAPALSPAEKSSFIKHGETSIQWPEEDMSQAPPVADPLSTPEIWSFENRLRAARKGSAAVPTFASDTEPARYVSFVGDTYAFLTDTHSVVVATDLVAGRLRPNQRLPERIVTELRSGDFVVFPESGDREFIQEKADQLLGAEAPGLRALAHTWKDALWASGITPEAFLRQAQDLKRSRHIATIRSWFADTSQIGPGIGDTDLIADLETIAIVTNHKPLEKELSQVAEAIKRLRGAHLSAGMRVRDALFQKLPQVIGKVDENETKVDLGELGSAWVVEVESIAPEVEKRGRTELNRLLWEEAQILLLV